VQVIIIALKNLVLFNVNFNKQVTGGATVNTRLAVTRRTNPHAVINPCGDLDLQGFIAASATHAITRHARVGNFFAITVTRRARLLHTEKTLLHPHCTGATAGVTSFRLSTNLGT
jgi:hypothetical protein